MTNHRPAEAEKARHTDKHPPLNHQRKSLPDVTRRNLVQQHAGLRETNHNDQPGRPQRNEQIMDVPNVPQPWLVNLQCVDSIDDCHQKFGVSDRQDREPDQMQPDHKTSAQRGFRTMQFSAEP